MDMTPAALAVLTLIITMWLASMGAVWKVATLLSSITSQLKDLRAETDRHALLLAAYPQGLTPSRPTRNGPSSS